VQCSKSRAEKNETENRRNRRKEPRHIPNYADAALRPPLSVRLICRKMARAAARCRRPPLAIEAMALVAAYAHAARAPARTRAIPLMRAAMPPAVTISAAVVVSRRPPTLPSPTRHPA
jgi:hypothetical protein